MFFSYHEKNEEDTMGKTTCYTTVLGLVLREQREQRGSHSSNGGKRWDDQCRMGKA